MFPTQNLHVKEMARLITPRALKALQPRIEALVDRLLDAAAERGRLDMIDDFAAAIPVQLIGDLLGIPLPGRKSRSGRGAPNLVHAGVTWTAG